MNLTTQEIIRDQFNLASLKELSQKHLKGEHWNEYQEINDHYRKKYEEIKRDHYKNYTVRVDVEMRRIMQLRAQPLPQLKPHYASDDRFNKADLKRQARINVDADHKYQINSLNLRQKKEIEGVIIKAKIGMERINEFNRVATQTRSRKRSR